MVSNKVKKNSAAVMKKKARIGNHFLVKHFNLTFPFRYAGLPLYNYILYSLAITGDPKVTSYKSKVKENSEVNYLIMGGRA